MILADNIYKSYGRKKILKGVSLSIDEGTCTGIIGINGAGKSTLLSVLAGISGPDKGTITYSFNGLQNIPRKNIHHYIGYVPQGNPLIEDLSVMDNLKLWYCNSSLNLDKELKEGFLYSLGINEFAHMKVSRLSGGMKKRLSIGIAMACNPLMLILDEPGAALDIICHKTIINYLTEYKKHGGSIVIATHDKDELALCDNLYIINDGFSKKIPSPINHSMLYEYLVNPSSPVK